MLISPSSVYPYHVAVHYIINNWCISLFVDFLLSNNHVNSIISHQFDFTDEEVSIVDQSIGILYFNLKSSSLYQTVNCKTAMFWLFVWHDLNPACSVQLCNKMLFFIFCLGHGILHLIYENTISASKQTYHTLLFQWGKFARGSFDQRTRIFL